MSLEAAVQENTAAIKQLITILSSGALAAAPAATATADTPAKGGKGKKAETAEAAAPAAAPATAPAPAPTEPKNEKTLDAMKAKVGQLVNDNSKGEGAGKKAATEILKGYGVKNIQSLFDLNKYDEVMAKVEAALAPAAAEDEIEL